MLECRSKVQSEKTLNKVKKTRGHEEVSQAPIRSKKEEVDEDQKG